MYNTFAPRCWQWTDLERKEWKTLELWNSKLFCKLIRKTFPSKLVLLVLLVYLFLQDFFLQNGGDAKNQTISFTLKIEMRKPTLKSFGNLLVWPAYKNDQLFGNTSLFRMTSLLRTTSLFRTTSLLEWPALTALQLYQTLLHNFILISIFFKTF